MDTFYLVIQLAGGIGIFLLGMIVLTEGLRSLAGNTIRSTLMRFTKSPATGAVTGAVSTAILQSSSATTVTAVGFVSAQLMTFPEALGIIFGANIGTTFKGWVIAILGFKLNLGSIFLPIVFIGAILRLFTKGKLATVGYTIAGFGLIFIGIAYMQESMSAMQGVISFDNLPADTITGRVLLLGMGILFTVITQSSSAGVVAALTALYADLINFNQAATLVIGMDIGTTMTAAMATIGGSTGAKRTGFSHVVYNLLTAMLALLLVSPYARLWEAISPGSLINNAEIALVAFHTMFNTLGVILIIPFAKQFANMMMWLIPDKVSVYTEKLDESLLEDPDLALTAAQTTIKKISLALFSHVSAILGDNLNGHRVDLEELQEALNDTQSFVDRIHLDSEDGAKWERLVQLIHTLDHLQRLHERCEEDEDRAMTVTGRAGLLSERDLLVETVKKVTSSIIDSNWPKAAADSQHTSSQLHKRVKPYRSEVMSSIASGEIDVNTGTQRLEAIRWLRRVGKHIARITMHFEKSILAAGT